MPSETRPTFGALAYAASFGADCMRREECDAEALALQWLADHMRQLLDGYDELNARPAVSLARDPHTGGTDGT